MNPEIFRQLISVYGWQEVESKNTVMLSFRHDDAPGRINFYYTTGTVTIQGTKRNDANMYHCHYEDFEKKIVKMSEE